MKRAILISCYYPPDGGVGVQRPRRLMEHANRCGWELEVVTRQRVEGRSTWEPEDTSLSTEADGQCVFRVPMPADSAAGAMVPCECVEDDPFLLGVFHRVQERLAASTYDAVILTMPPYGMAPLVPAIRSCSSVPIVVDLRDPWALDGACVYRDRRQWAVTNRWMQRVLGLADGVVANTPEAGKQLVQAVSGLDSERVAVVNNGCDIRSFQGPMPARPDSMEPGVFHLVHTGTLHSNAFERTSGLSGLVRKWRNHRAEPIQIGGRTAHHLLKAMDRLERETPELMEQVRLTLVGVEDDPTRRMVERAACRERVSLTGFVPYNESVAWIRHADALFLPLFGLPAGHRSRIIPYKTYEYLASGRPILGALPQGDARDLVERSGRGVCADPCDDDALAKGLRTLLQRAGADEREQEELEPFVYDFDWPKQCDRFFEFMDRLTRDGAVV